MFKRQWAGITAPLYAVEEGLFLVGISAIFEEQLKNDNYEIQGLLDEITENMTEESLVEEISKIENSIERIGPINLAAA